MGTKDLLMLTHDINTQDEKTENDNLLGSDKSTDEFLNH
jgi:hypothetical protein